MRPFLSLPLDYFEKYPDLAHISLWKAKQYVSVTIKRLLEKNEQQDYNELTQQKELPFVRELYHLKKAGR